MKELKINKIRVPITKYGIPVGEHSYASVEEYERVLRENDDIENIVITKDFVEYELKIKNLNEETSILEEYAIEHGYSMENFKGRCKTCEYWKLYKYNENFGLCNNEKLNSLTIVDYVKDIIRFIDGIVSNEEVIFGKDFCCIHYKTLVDIEDM